MGERLTAENSIQLSEIRETSGQLEGKSVQSIRVICYDHQIMRNGSEREEKQREEGRKGCRSALVDSTFLPSETSPSKGATRVRALTKVLLGILKAWWRARGRRKRVGRVGGQGGRLRERCPSSVDPQTLVELDLIDLTVDFHRMPYALEPSCLPAREIWAKISARPALTTLVALPQCQ